MGYLRGTNKQSNGQYYTPRYKNVTARLRKVERIQARRKPEVHHGTWTVGSTALADGAIAYQHITSISEGVSAFQRKGDEVRIMGVLLRGHVSAHDVDVYLIKAPSDVNTPIASDFTQTVGGQLADTVLDQKYQELRHWRNHSGANGNFTIKRKFPWGMKVHYLTTAGSSANNNKLYLVIKNNTGASINFEFTARTFFTDS